ncbi:MAG: hypothetical protein K6F69_03935, partial [Treponema sp.]|nr:hypothetical protein [Treponema sp.]
MTKIIGIIVAFLILAYSAIIFAVVNLQLNKGLISYFQNDVKSQSSLIIDEFDSILLRLLDTSNYLKNEFERFVVNNAFNESTAADVCDSALMNLDVDSMYVVDSDGNELYSHGNGINEDYVSLSF